jgi:hypothetical protein
MANKKKIFVIRADGSAIGRAGGFWTGNNVLSARLQPGDTVVVPEKIVGGSRMWQDLLGTAQIMTTIGLTAAVAMH